MRLRLLHCGGPLAAGDGAGTEGRPDFGTALRAALSVACGVSCRVRAERSCPSPPFDESQGGDSPHAGGGSPVPSDWAEGFGRFRVD